MSNPLFIPLRAEFYDAFATGAKTDELRKHGPRWNERTCPIGRRVVLSRGYGKAHRLSGHIWKFKKQHGTTFGSTYRASIERIYGTLDVDIACIGIQLDAGADDRDDEKSFSRAEASGDVPSLTYREKPQREIRGRRS